MDGEKTITIPTAKILTLGHKASAQQLRRGSLSLTGSTRSGTVTARVEIAYLGDQDLWNIERSDELEMEITIRRKQK